MALVSSGFRLAGPLVWWGWLVLCSLPRQAPVPAEATASLTQALLAIHFPVAAFTLAFWTLQDPRTRTWCRRLVIACALYLGGQMLLQALTKQPDGGF
ncbi:hypothetical protein [Gluconobacter oxydans]|uniref:Uncharacterized protein n=2 Tax=Gluconobacter oxydans TaxID=442 RepID=A0AB35ARI6_GLUOY|nr:hypothetical protein [Gluconobacter oxydans]KXV36242.1 hypothetical protein AD939_00590 [Gluconobacter oxydans]MBF0857526.1 hypothetical protein [Gluconobacter oxydans]